MKQSRQQQQTKKFFEKDASNWFKKSKLNPRSSLNIIDQRNQFVQDICLQFLSKNSRTLDVGCGTGDLVIKLLKKKLDSYGIDFAKSMIDKAKSQSKKLNLSLDKFILSSFFDFKPEIKYHLISANGFIEYISEDQFELFIKKSYNMLEDNGILVIGSRNRLFNIFSFNEFTNVETRIGSLVPLIKECILFNSAKNLGELLKTDYKPKIPKNIAGHSHTGIKVDTRYQYTPFQIIQKLKRHGFEIVDLIPIHIHLLSTGAKSILPSIHNNTSNYMQNRIEAHLQVIPQSSSFMIAARKK